MVVVKEVKNMFWGVTLDGGKRYTQTVEQSFHISMAALEPKDTGEKSPVSVMIQHDKAEFMLCTLQQSAIYQQTLDLNFTEGEEITFFLNGSGIVHLTGYLVDEEFEGGQSGLEDMILGSEEEETEEDDADEESSEEEMDEEESEEEDVPTLQAIAAAGDLEEDEDEEDEDDWQPDSDKKNKRQKLQKNQPTKKLKKAEEEEEESEEEDDEDEDSEDEEDDDDFLLDEVDDEDEEEEDEEEEEEEDDEEKKVEEGSYKAEVKPKKTEQPSPAAQENGTQSSQKKKKKKKKNKENKEKTEKATPPQPQKPPQPKKPKILNLAGGIKVEEVKEGHGPPAKAGKTVHVYYSGKLANGKMFDSCIKGKPFRFKLGKNEVIKGWDVGLEGMKVGGKRKLTIPSKMGYGNQRVGSIPSNSALVFDVELKAVS